MDVIYPTAEIVMRENEPVADNVNLPRLSVLVPMWVLKKVMLTNDIGWLVSASITLPLIMVCCAIQPSDMSKKAQHNTYLRSNDNKKGINYNVT
jgi:hypothetical protein